MLARLHFFFKTDRRLPAACLPVCLSACLPACLPAHPPACRCVTPPLVCLPVPTACLPENLESNRPQTRRNQQLHPKDIVVLISDRKGSQSTVVSPAPVTSTPVIETETRQESSDSSQDSTGSSSGSESIRRSLPDMSTTPSPADLPFAKPPRPSKFDGTDTSLTTINTWAYEVEEYMDLAKIAAEDQTRHAGTLLSGQAKTWFINTYQGVHPRPSLNAFLAAFKEQFQGSQNNGDIIRRVETIDQGTWTVAQYSTEFEMLILQLGKEVGHDWSTGHYLRGLNKGVRLAVLPALTGEETLKVLIRRAATVARNLDYGKDLERKMTSTTPRFTGSTSNSNSSRSGTPAASGTLSKSRTKLTDAERQYLMENEG